MTPAMERRVLLCAEGVAYVLELLLMLHYFGLV